MKNTKLSKVMMVMILLISLCAISIPEAVAKNNGYKKNDWSKKHNRRHHPYYGRKVSFPEMIAKAIFVSGLKYQYHNGVFYQRFGSNYIIVDAPIGAKVSVLPLGSKRFLINGRRYYYYNGVYFVRKPLGYFVVEDPIYQVTALSNKIKFIDDEVLISTGSRNQRQRSEDEEFVVNILNTNGSYNRVKIVSVDNGFIGPQGEYYTKFPRVEQLRVMYGN